MKITIFNPPHFAIGSRIPKENLPPLGLLYVGGALIDAGYETALINADLKPLSPHQCCNAIMNAKTDILLIGHSGSSSAHPTIVEIAKLAKTANPKIIIIYGGVYPTYHWADILTETDLFDYIVRGEGEVTVVNLVNAIANNQPIAEVSGIAYLKDCKPNITKPQLLIRNIDDQRIGWELIDFNDYSYWGGKKSVIMQFSRGCPHFCTYCGQNLFWQKWRHRDPQKFAEEIAWLVNEHGVELVNLADENPTSSRRQWKLFLEALIELKVDVLIVGSTRADDIVRDHDILHLYKQAGVIRFLMGIESTDESVLQKIKKGSSNNVDKQAIKLLRKNGIIGLATFAIGFESEVDKDYWRVLKTLLNFDPDQIMSVYATPHRWTPFYETVRTRKVIQPNLKLWDYKHQVMDVPAVPAWRVFMWVKFIEITLQARPTAVMRLFYKDKERRHAMRWYTKMARRVFVHELMHFLIFDKRKKGGNVQDFWSKSN